MNLSEPLVARMIGTIKADIENHKGFLWLGGTELAHSERLKSWLVELERYYAENFEGTLEENQKAREAAFAREFIKTLKDYDDE
jgi:hypothetical protein